MKKNNKGSFTVEAAIVVPIFFLALLVFLYFFRIMLLQLQLQSGLTEAATELSQVAYMGKNEDKDNKADSAILEKLNVGKNVIIKNEIMKYFTEQDSYTQIIDGDISYSNSQYLGEDDVVDLVGEYCIEIPIPLFNLTGINVIQRVRTRAFTGTTSLLTTDDTTQDDLDNTEYVYITEMGTVYHSSLACSALKLNIEACSLEELVNKRNSSGAKYKECEKCCNDSSSITSVFICEDGESYHTSIECSGLKRTIQKVRLCDIKDEMRGCKRCVT